jgi:hypothetical protein
MEPSCAALHSSDSLYDDTLAVPEIPAEVHTRERSLYDAPQGIITAQDPFSDENGLLTPLRPWVEDLDGDAASLESSETFHTAVTADPPNTYPHHGLRRTDIVPSLTPDRRFRRGKSKIHDHQTLLQKANIREDFKLRLARAKEEVRVLQSLDPRASTSRFSLRDLRSKGSFNGREIDYQNPIPSLARSWFFWASLSLMLAGLSQTSAAAAFIVAKKADGVKVNSWIIFWLVCSIVALVVGSAATSIVFMKKGNACRGFLERLGLNEVRNWVDRDMESGRRGGLLYLGVCDREGSSMLGESREDNSVQIWGSNRRRAGRSTTGSSKTVSIHTVDYNSIQDPRWKDLYTTPDPSRHPASIRSSAPYEPSPLRHRVSQDDEEDIGAQQLGPTPPLRQSYESVRYIPGREGAVSRMGFYKDEIEMVDLGGASKEGTVKGIHDNVQVSKPFK